MSTVLYLEELEASLLTLCNGTDSYWNRRSWESDRGLVSSRNMDRMNYNGEQIQSEIKQIER